jgi:hypothetical protein
MFLSCLRPFSGGKLSRQSFLCGMPSCDAYAWDCVKLLEEQHPLPLPGKSEGKEKKCFELKLIKKTSCITNWTILLFFAENNRSVRIQDATQNNT